MAEYALAAVDYSLMLTTLVNPTLAVPLLVMLHYTLTIASGEHPSDWPHAVRFLETEMQNPIDPSGWPQLLETLAPDIRRAGLDAKQQRLPQLRFRPCARYRSSPTAPVPGLRTRRGPKTTTRLDPTLQELESR